MRSCRACRSTKLYPPMILLCSPNFSSLMFLFLMQSFHPSFHLPSALHMTQVLLSLTLPRFHSCQYSSQHLWKILTTPHLYRQKRSSCVSLVWNLSQPAWKHSQWKALHPPDHQCVSHSFLVHESGPAEISRWNMTSFVTQLMTFFSLDFCIAFSPEHVQVLFHGVSSWMDCSFSSSHWKMSKVCQRPYFVDWVMFKSRFSWLVDCIFLCGILLLKWEL